MKYTEHFSTKETPQTMPIPGKEELQTKNSAGGYSFRVDPFARLDRFLILGTEGGSFYASEKKLTLENVKNIIELIKEDGEKVLNRVVETSQKGLAPKNDPAIFVMALLCTFGNVNVKQLTYGKIKDVCRTGTHLFNFCQSIQDLRGWSHGLRRGISKFYEIRNTEQLTNQIIKYRQRNGWTHRDVIRLAHPKFKEDQVGMVYDVLGKPKVMPLPKAYEAFKEIQTKGITDVKTICSLITEYKLPWEVVPTEFLNDIRIWEALLPSLGLTALLRNLNRLSKLRMISETGMDENSKYIRERLLNVEELKSARLHPLNIINAKLAYQEQCNFFGKMIDTLEDAFYLSFGNIETSGKRILLGLDVSASMTWNPIAGTQLTPRDASAVLAMVTARSEEDYHFMAFSQRFERIPITKKSSLGEVLREISHIHAGGTDCSLPMIWALQNRVPIDVFSVYTDNETLAGAMHPSQALEKYRQQMGIDAKLVVVGMQSNGFTIADPTDLRQLDIVGFSLDTPQAISAFARS